jgi:HEPN domain-containing protein
MANEHFISAARKHYNDAAILHDAGRHDNCAYLAGYVVECALKGMIETSNALNPRCFGHDVSALSTKAALLAALLSPGRTFITIPTSQDYLNLLTKWMPEERYKEEQTTPVGTSNSRLTAAKEVIQAIVIPLTLNGAKL